MKKKFFAILLCLTMILGLATTAAASPADSEPVTTGSITVNNPAVGDTYNLYKIFDATYSGTNVAYTMAADSVWKTVVEQHFDVTPSADDADVLVIEKKDNYDAKAFSNALRDYLNAHSEIEADATTTVGANTKSYTFNSLDFGYYMLVNANVDGKDVVVSLDSAIPNAEINDKNQNTPSWPEEPEEGKDADKTNAGVGDVVTFTVKVDTTNYAPDKNALDENGDPTVKQISKYIITDTPDESYTFNNDANVKAEIQYKVGGTWTKAVDATVTATEKADGTVEFEIPWVDANGASLYASPARIVLTYTATVNEKVQDINNNSATFTYQFVGKNDPEEPGTPSEEKVYSYTIDLTKTKADGAQLEGAEFKLYADEALATEILLVEDGDNYRVATAEEIAADEDIVDVIKAGHVQIKGLAAGTYYLLETKAPAGYNKLKEAVAVEIKDQDQDDQDLLTAVEATTVSVENKSGTELPATGGIGTTIFYVVGGVLVVAAGVLLVVKKRTAK